MAGFLRPRRGRRSTAESQAIILKRGEVFFECPDTGVGTGTGKIKVGDGTTAYADLPYFMDLSSVTTDVAGSAIAFTESTTTDNATLLASIKSGATLKTMISAMKKLLSNLDTSVTQLNNDLANKANSNHTHTQYASTDHTHSNYVSESQVVSIVNSSISNGGINMSMIRYIKRGTVSLSSNMAQSSKSISCTITDTSKVIVLLNTSSSHDTDNGVYLSSVSKENIVVECYTASKTLKFSYQIIEFM